MLRTFLTAAAAVLACGAAYACDTCGCKDAKHDASHAAGEEHLHDVVDTAVESGDFTTLVAAVKAAGLVDTLKGEGPFTVFAPNDAAFAKLGEAKIAELLQPENKGQLTSILTYHVVPGKVMAADVTGISSADTVNGAQAPIAVEGGDVMVAGAKVLVTDIECSNGVIHVIDSVMLP